MTASCWFADGIGHDISLGRFGKFSPSIYPKVPEGHAYANIPGFYVPQGVWGGMSPEPEWTVGAQNPKGSAVSAGRFLVNTRWNAHLYRKDMADLWKRHEELKNEFGQRWLRATNGGNAGGPGGYMRHLSGTFPTISNDRGPLHKAKGATENLGINSAMENFVAQTAAFEQFASQNYWKLPDGTYTTDSSTTRGGSQQPIPGSLTLSDMLLTEEPRQPVVFAARGLVHQLVRHSDPQNAYKEFLLRLSRTHLRWGLTGSALVSSARSEWYEDIELVWLQSVLVRGGVKIASGMKDTLKDAAWKSGTLGDVPDDAEPGNAALPTLAARTSFLAEVLLRWKKAKIKTSEAIHQTPSGPDQTMTDLSRHFEGRLSAVFDDAPDLWGDPHADDAEALRKTKENQFHFVAHFQDVFRGVVSLYRRNRIRIQVARRARLRSRSGGRSNLDPWFPTVFTQSFRVDPGTQYPATRINIRGQGDDKAAMRKELAQVEQELGRLGGAPAPEENPPGKRSSQSPRPGRNTEKDPSSPSKDSSSSGSRMSISSREEMLVRDPEELLFLLKQTTKWVRWGERFAVHQHNYETIHITARSFATDVVRAWDAQHEPAFFQLKRSCAQFRSQQQLADWGHFKSSAQGGGPSSPVEMNCEVQTVMAIFSGLVYKCGLPDTGAAVLELTERMALVLSVLETGVWDRVGGFWGLWRKERVRGIRSRVVCFVRSDRMCVVFAKKTIVDFVPAKRKKCWYIRDWDIADCPTVSGMLSMLKACRSGFA